ncbi:putative traE protein [Clostridioides difficile P51]|nr:putative traE protein [Clostridioides difficile P51]
MPLPFGAGTAGASSRAAPPRQRLPLPVFMGYDPQNRAFHQRLYRPGQLRLPFQPTVPGGDDLGRCLLLADFGLGALGQAAGGAFGNGCGNDHHPPYPNRRSGRRRKIHQGQSLRH